MTSNCMDNLNKLLKNRRKEHLDPTSMTEKFQMKIFIDLRV